MRDEEVAEAPFALQLAQQFDDLCLDRESSADVGSSSTMNSGSSAMARAMAMRWRWPPENSCGKRDRILPGMPAMTSASRTRSMRSFLVAPMLLTISPSSMIWPIVMRGLSDENGSWNTTCMRERKGRISDRDLPWMGWPSKWISPLVALLSLSSASPKVVLPDPDSPTSPSVSWRRRLRSRLSTATSSRQSGLKKVPCRSMKDTRTRLASRMMPDPSGSGLAWPRGSDPSRCCV
ncbi:hypothetical protein AJ88_48575 [Mesorhizobium amorphae CCBAU 01583]|nr:hypothetical protein AJ88_48575 [Mesorhizobium amorphae CCBAU 01583]